MKKSHIAIASVALAVGIGVGWFLHSMPAPIEVNVLAPPASPSAASAAPTTGPSALPDSFMQLAQIPPSSPEYARAQRILGWNYYAQTKHDLAEAKKHVDLALATSPDDTKVLEDAGRVYMLAGYTNQGAAMLKRAGTRVAMEFLARQPGG